jgi:Fe-S oxidoreductase
LTHPKLSRLQERFRTRNVRLSAKLHEAYSARLFAEEAQVAFFPGCDVIDQSIDDIRDALCIFDSLDLNFVRLMEVPYVCAGYPLWAGGCTDAARFVAADLVRSLRRFATVVVGCAACTWLLREKLPAEGFEHNTEILHLSEFLYVHAERLDIRQTKPAAFFHDPCYLGRHLGVYDPPRRLVSRCVNSLREFFYNREEGECCGGGGLVPHTFREATSRQARRRLEEAVLFDVPLVVTACPSCKRTFRSVDVGVEVMDLVNLLSWSIQAPERSRLE